VIAILFGAGASSGVGGVFPSAPPLGRNLYAELAQSFPDTWGKIPEPLAREFDDDFEVAMSRLWESGTPAIGVLMQQVALYFCRFRLPGDRRDAYSDLIDRLRARGRLRATRFASLNYECLFEDAVDLAGLRVAYFAREPREGELAVWKPHGSCNFLPLGPIDVPPEAGLPPDVVIDTDVRPVSREEVVRFCERDSALYPAMAVYARGKPIQVAPRAVERTHGYWAEACERAEAIVVVGVKPQPADVHIWDPIARAPGRVLYVGAPGPFDDWRRARRPGARGDAVLGERFDQAVARIAEAA
jgi:hypothetical protein